MPTDSLNSALPAAADGRLRGLMASDAILDPANPQFAAVQQEAQELSKWNDLVNHPAYFDAAHPQHELIKTRVTRYFESQAASAAPTRRPNPIVFSTSADGAVTSHNLMSPKEA